MGLFRFDAFCGVDLVPHVQNVNQYYCCDDFTDDTLHIVPGDVWTVPHPAGTYQDVYLYKGGTSLGIISSLAPSPDNTFSFILSFDANTKWRLAYTCDGVSACSNIIDRQDYLTDDDFLDAIVTEMMLFLPITVVRTANAFSITFTSAVACLCNSTVFSKEGISETSCGVTPIVIREADLCNTAIYSNFVVIQYESACVSFTQIECFERETHTNLTFPSNLNDGCYHLFVNGFGCTQQIRLTTGCNYPAIQYRNFGQQFTTYRIGIEIRNPNVRKTQEISKSTRGELRKLYTTYEKLYEMVTDYYSEQIHGELSVAVESDIFQVGTYWNQSNLPFFKSFVAEETYKVNWSKDFPTRRLAQAEMVLIEKEYTYINTFCNA